jgi:hypothetical protein
MRCRGRRTLGGLPRLAVPSVPTAVAGVIHDAALSDRGGRGRAQRGIRRCDLGAARRRGVGHPSDEQQYSPYRDGGQEGACRVPAEESAFTYDGGDKNRHDPPATGADKGTTWNRAISQPHTSIFRVFVTRHGYFSPS